MKTETEEREGQNFPALRGHEFSYLVDVQIRVEKIRIPVGITVTHLKKNGSPHEAVEWILGELKALEERIDKTVAKSLEKHPAYPWFSKIRGIGKENIAKVLGLIDIEKAPHPSSLWQFAGYGADTVCPECGFPLEKHEVFCPRCKKNVKPIHIPQKRRKGIRMSYNGTLKTMCYRLGSGILRAGIRHRCSVCGELVGRSQIPGNDKNGSASPDKIHACPGATFTPVAISRYAGYYLEQKAQYAARFLREGREIVPASKLPVVKQRKMEGDAYISEGHLHNMAQRKMIKLFLAHLWLVWREALGLPVSQPYPLEKMGHAHFIDPWDMVDEE